MTGPRYLIINFTNRRYFEAIILTTIKNYASISNHIVLGLVPGVKKIKPRLQNKILGLGVF